MSLPRLLTTIRALPPTPFRTAGQPQLFDALEGMVARALSLPPDAGEGALAAKDKGMSEGMRRRVKAAEEALARIEGSVALDKVSEWRGRRDGGDEERAGLEESSEPPRWPSWP
jgi:hypothetical protein